MEDTRSIDARLKVLVQLHESALETWPDDGTERTLMRKRRLEASRDVVIKAMIWLKQCRQYHPDEELLVYVLFINYLQHYRSQILWKPVNYENPLEVVIFQGSLKGYDMIDERIYS